MSFIALLRLEFIKLRRSKIGLLMIAPLLLVWGMAVVNGQMNFEMAAEGLSPEHNFFIQSYLSFAAFMLPASLVVLTVLLSQTERANGGMTKMLSLPISSGMLCLGKLCVLLLLMGGELLLLYATYFPAALIAARIWDYPFVLSALYVGKVSALLWLVSIPMAAVYWLISVLIFNPVASLAAGLASVVPIILAINTEIWYLYPMCYPMMLVTREMHQLATNMGDFSVALLPWLPVAIGIGALCVLLACLFFGRALRK